MPPKYMTSHMKPKWVMAFIYLQVIKIDRGQMNISQLLVQ